MAATSSDSNTTYVDTLDGLRKLMLKTTAIVPMRFENLTKNENENQSMMLLTGPIVQKCDLLRGFLVLVFGDKVQEQKMGFYTELVAMERPEGPPVLDRANALEGFEVSMAEVAVLNGAFVVDLGQLENYAEWKTWPNTPQAPHITLAFIGEEKMGGLSLDLKILVLRALGFLASLAMDEEHLFEKLAKVVNVVRLYVDDPSPNSDQIYEAMNEIADIILLET